MNYKQKANLTLASVFIIFCITSVFQHFWPKILLIQMCYFIMEAALIGGIADWFAVTALFQKPLNWPFHTALIPRNREKVINSVSQMVQHDLLSFALIRQKIEQLNMSDYLIHWIEEDGHLKSIIDSITKVVEEWLINLEPKAVTRVLTPVISKKLIENRLFPQLQAFIIESLTNGQMDKFLESIIKKLNELVLQENIKTIICDFLQEQKAKKVSNGAISKFLLSMLEASGGLNLEEAAEALQTQLKYTLQLLKNSDHPLRITIKEVIYQAVTELEQNSEVVESIENWKKDIISSISIAEQIEISLNRMLYNPDNGKKSLLQTLLSETLEVIWNFYRNNDSVLRLINVYLQGVLFKLIEFNQNFIGDIARDAFSEFTNDDLIHFIEDKAGNDLQWIRINGSIIGGLVGFILFVFIKVLYDPYVLPLLTSWILH